MSNNGVITELREWRRQGAELREKLNQRAASLRAELAEVERALALIPDEDEGPEPEPAPEVGPASSVVESSDDGRETAQNDAAASAEAHQTIPDLIKAALRDTPNINSEAIIAAVQRARPNVRADHVHSNLYRLKTTKKILARGKKGARKYRLPDAE